MNQNPRLIISLTSYGSRLSTLHICLNSLLAQTKKADKIVVYFYQDEIEKLTPQLKALEKEGVEFRFVDLDLRPHKKYYYAMQEYPDDIIVTVDDDVIYHQDMLKELYRTYQKFPRAIVTGRAHEITFSEDGTIRPYDDWKWEVDQKDQPSMKLLATGAGGILYPPHLLNLDLLLNLKYIRRYLTVDDLWLKAVEVLDGIPTVVCDSKIEKLRLGIPDTQTHGLFNKNVGENENDKYLKDLEKEFFLNKKINAYS